MERRAAGIEVVRWCGGGQRASGSEGLGKTSPPVQCVVKAAAAAAEGNDLMGSGGLRRRRRIGKTLSPAAAVGDDVGSGRRMGTTSSPPAAGRGGWGSSSGGEDLSPLVQCAPAAEGDDDARSESRVERVMTAEA
uniref:DUF834 domain-containing protein n=1 Tax=Oryza glaberrima TaxID=4538 RepID=I1PB73_ORYGL